MLHSRYNGTMPQELARTKSWDYSIMNLRGFFTLATMAEHIDVDLWNYQSESEGSIQGSLLAGIKEGEIMRRTSTALLVFVAIGAIPLWYSTSKNERQANAQEPTQESNADDADSELRTEIAKLKEEVAILKAKAPDQAHSMTDVDYHFANLWFAGRAENWPLAEFYWKETVSHMKWAVRIIPVRKDNAGDEIKLEAILESILQSPWMQVGKTIEQQDVSEFEKAYKYTLGGCYNCHKASDKPYLRPQIPERPASSLINFDSKATWPE